MSSLNHSEVFNTNTKKTSSLKEVSLRLSQLKRYFCEQLEQIEHVIDDISAQMHEKQTTFDTKVTNGYEQISTLSSLSSSLSQNRGSCNGGNDTIVPEEMPTKNLSIAKLNNCELNGLNGSSNLLSTPSPSLPLLSLNETILKKNEPETPVAVATVASSNSGGGNALKEIAIPYGQYIDISLSYIYSSRNFFVHINYDDVETFYLNFNQYYANIEPERINLDPNTLKANNLCCVFFCEDSSYYRAQVICGRENRATNEYLVKMLDFGDMRMVEGQYFYKLAPEFFPDKTPIWVLHCFLNDYWTWDFSRLEAAFPDFVQMPNTYCKAIRAKFEPPIFNNMYPVSIKIQTYQGQCLELQELCHFENIIVPDLISNKVLRYNELSKSVAGCYNNSVEALKRFFIKNPIIGLPNVCTGTLPYIQDPNNFVFIASLAVEFTTNLSFCYLGQIETISTRNIIADSLVVFVWNKFYYRGFILSVGGVDNVQVLAIDFGFVVGVKQDELFPLLDMFRLNKMPVFAWLCSLDNLSPVTDSGWTALAIKTFKTFFQGKFTIFPRSHSKGVFFVEIELPNKTRPIDMLKKFHLAKESSTTISS